MVNIEKLKNGLTVIVEELPHFQSVSYDLTIPGGLVVDPDPIAGLSLLLAELTERGAGELDSRQLSDAYDALGARHGSSAGIDRYSYRGTVLSDCLADALKLLALQIQSPRLPQEEVPSIQELMTMDTRSLSDAPARLTNIELTKRFLPAPYNRTGYPAEATIAAMGLDAARALWKEWFAPSGAILSVAGNCTTATVLSLIEEVFGAWKGVSPELPKFGAMPSAFKHHITQEAAQTQICLAYPSCKFGEELYYAAKVANEVLSGGMFGRLFIEVREKRGLCYSVHSRHSSGKNSGSVLAYAGTTPDRASQTLSVMVEVLKGIKGTVSNEELARAKANLKASLIIGEESPGARASSNGGDYWLIKRVRSLSEIAQAIESVTKEQIDAYIDRYSPEQFSLVTLGSKELA